MRQLRIRHHLLSGLLWHDARVSGFTSAGFAWIVLLLLHMDWSRLHFLLCGLLALFGLAFLSHVGLPWLRHLFFLLLCDNYFLRFLGFGFGLRFRLLHRLVSLLPLH